MAKCSKIVAIILASSYVSGAAAEECQSYVGQTVIPKTFDAVALTLKAVPSSKGEYETTAAFEQRLAAHGIDPHPTIISTKLDPQFLTYDADRGELVVKSYALRNINTEYRGLFGYGKPLYEKFSLSTGNIDWVVSSTDTVQGGYRASNAFGATVSVQKKIRIDRSVFQEPDPSFGTDLWTDADKDAVLGRIPMTVSDAKNLKALGRGAIVFVPKSPYFAEGVSHSTPTIENRTDLTQIIKVIFADIQCGLILDGSNKVLGAYKTR